MPKVTPPSLAGDFEVVVRYFFDVIIIAPTNHVLYSNRFMAYASLNKFSEALADAKKIVEFRPDWAKEYSHLGAIH